MQAIVAVETKVAMSSVNPYDHMKVCIICCASAMLMLSYTILSYSYPACCLQKLCSAIYRNGSISRMFSFFFFYFKSALYRIFETVASWHMVMG